MSQDESALDSSSERVESQSSKKERQKRQLSNSRSNDRHHRRKSRERSDSRERHSVNGRSYRDNDGDAITDGNIDNILSYEKDRKKEKEKDRDRDREKEKSEKSRHRERDREREKSRERERSRERGRDGHRSHRHRSHDHDYDDEYIEKSHRRSRSHSKSRSPRRHSSSYLDDEVLPLDQWPRKLKNWDVPPKGFEGMSVDQVKNTGLFIPPSIQPKVTNLTPFVDPNRAAMIMQTAGDPSNLASVAANINPILAKQTRRIYVSGLPMDVSQEEIAHFFNDLMNSYSFSSGPGSAVIEVILNLEKNYAFVDMRSPEEATQAMSFDGITFNGHILKIRRPKDYQPVVSETGGINMISSMVADTPYKIFIGCIPYSLNEEQIIELLKPFGDLKSFHLVRESPSGLSKGFAFCEYINPEVTDLAAAGLNGLELGDKRLVVQRASIGANKPATGIQQMLGVGMLPPTTASSAVLPALINKGQMAPSTVVQLLNMVTPEELVNDMEYQDILEDVTSECGKFGRILDICIPRLSDIDKRTLLPLSSSASANAVGKIFVQYSNVDEATRALQALSGRKFNDRTVMTAYYPLELFINRDF